MEILTKGLLCYSYLLVYMFKVLSNYSKFNMLKFSFNIICLVLMYLGSKYVAFDESDYDQYVKLEQYFFFCISFLRALEFLYVHFLYCFISSQPDPVHDFFSRMSRRVMLELFSLESLLQTAWTDWYDSYEMLGWDVLVILPCVSSSLWMCLVLVIYKYIALDFGYLAADCTISCFLRYRSCVEYLRAKQRMSVLPSVL